MNCIGWTVLDGAEAKRENEQSIESCKRKSLSEAKIDGMPC